MLPNILAYKSVFWKMPGEGRPWVALLMRQVIFERILRMSQ